MFTDKLKSAKPIAYVRSYMGWLIASTIEEIADSSYAFHKIVFNSGKG